MTDKPPTPDLPPEPWITAVAAVLRPFAVYARERLKTGDLDECRRAAKVSEETADLFEEILDAISDDDAGDEAEAGAA